MKENNEFKEFSQNIKIIEGKKEFKELINKILKDIDRKITLENSIKSFQENAKSISPVRVSYKKLFSIIDELEKEYKNLNNLEKDLIKYKNIKEFLENKSTLNKCLKYIENKNSIENSFNKENLKESLETCLKEISINNKNIEISKTPPTEAETLFGYWIKDKKLNVIILNLVDSIFSKILITFLIFLFTYSLLSNVLSSNSSPFYKIIQTLNETNEVNNIKENSDKNSNINIFFPGNLESIENESNKNAIFNKLTLILLFLTDLTLFILTFRLLEKKFLYGNLEKDYSQDLKKYTKVSIFFVLYSFINYLNELESFGDKIGELFKKSLEALIALIDKLLGLLI